MDGKDNNSKIINISIEEKPTGEISLGAGAGTNGTTVGFAVKENNFLGKGVNFVNSISVSDETIKGEFKVSNPNYKNTDRSVSFGIQAIEIDRASSFGYKTNKTGFSVGTGFEYFKILLSISILVIIMRKFLLMVLRQHYKKHKMVIIGIIFKLSFRF